ncbi:MAG TPA: hypothetical protein VG844_11450 [Terracidiphilus sp.]|nr:hypothetical protein [Terracidiphilus sp.]
MDASGIERKPSKFKEAFGSTALKIENLDGDLQFTLARTTGWLDVVLISSVVSASGFFGFFTSNIFLIVCAIFSLFVALFKWAQGPITTLRVSETRVLATGNLLRWKNGDILIDASDIKSIGWAYGSEYRPQGIYVWKEKSGLKSECVLPGISYTKAKQITDAITARFSKYKIASGPIVGFTITPKD